VDATFAFPSARTREIQIRISEYRSACRTTALLLAVVATFAACRGESPSSKKLDVVRVARSGFLTNAPILIADDEGFFAREGVRIEYIAMPQNSVQELPSLERGDVDVVAAAVSVGLINGVANGAAFRIVADRGWVDPTSCETAGIVGRREVFANQPLTATLLRGRSVSTNPVGQSGYLLSRFLERYGLTFSDVKVQRLAPDVEIQAMDNGGIDIASRSDPYLHTLLAKGHVLLGGSVSLVPNTNTAVLVYGPTLLQRNRNLGLRFMRGYLQGVRQYDQGHTSRNLEVISRRLGIKSSDLNMMCWPQTRTDGAIIDSSLVAYQQWAVNGGHMKKVSPASSLVDTEFSARASRGLDSAARAH
jgi:ABC-type nitrate/sulfonate/bicarbonate transport system substrate-binding protein